MLSKVDAQATLASTAGLRSQLKHDHEEEEEEEEEEPHSTLVVLSSSLATSSFLHSQTLDMTPSPLPRSNQPAAVGV